jgi:hypothetical protein
METPINNESLSNSSIENLSGIVSENQQEMFKHLEPGYFENLPKALSEHTETSQKLSEVK